MSKPKKPRAPRKPKSQPASSSSATSSSSDEPARDEGGTVIPTNKGKAGKGAKQSFLPDL